MSQNKIGAEEVRQLVGQNVKRLRERSRLSQEEVSEKAKISRNFLSEIENGEKYPSAGTIADLMYALSAPAFAFFLPLEDKNPHNLRHAITNVEDDLVGDIYAAIEAAFRSVRVLTFGENKDEPIDGTEDESG